MARVNVFFRVEAERLGVGKGSRDYLRKTYKLFAVLS